MIRDAGLKKLDAALDAAALQIVRGHAVSYNAEIMDLTAKYFEALSSIAWRGYLIEFVEEQCALMCE